MEIQLLTQADFVLSKCGRPTAPGGLSVVYIKRGFMVQTFFAANTTAPTNQVTKEITGDTNWCLRYLQITSTAAQAISLQILQPNGKFLISSLQDSLQIAGYGSYCLLFTKELECPPGSKIQVTFANTNTGSAQPIAIEFGGAYKYLLKTGAQTLCPVETIGQRLPRYFGNANQNIMAPAWMQGVSCPTPAGWQDQEFVYTTVPNPLSTTNLPGSTVMPVAGPFQGLQEIAIDQGSDFRCRRLLCAVDADNTVTAGTVLARIRTGSGYALTDDYIDVAQYLQSSPMPIDWKINRGDSVFLDLQLVDYAGTGNIYFQTWLEGVKRWRGTA